MLSQDSYFASTVDPPGTTNTLRRSATARIPGRFTPEDLLKIASFDKYYQQLLQEKAAQSLQDNIAIEEQVNLQDVNLQNNSGKYYYFVGRANPPHDGHIEGLLSLCLHAIENEGTAIILLGSGPNNGARTSKDPLDFDLKSRFIKDKLKDKLKDKGYSDKRIDDFFTDGTIQIQEMDKPVDQIRNVMREDINKKSLSELEAIRLSGDKEGGEDLNKLKWMEKALNAGIFDSEGNLIPIRATVIPVPAVQIEGASEPMSATTIRNIIYEMDPSISDADVISNFKAQIGNFYVTSGYDYTPAIAAAINQYKPNPNILGTKRESEGTVKKTKKPKGGSRRKTNKRHKLTKRRKTKRRRTRTRKTKRRRSQRN